MSFRERQKFHPSSSIPVADFEQKELPSGEFVTEAVNVSDAMLPDPELFDLKNQLEAGVTQEEVNSKVLSTKSVSAERIVRKYTKTPKNTVTTEDSHEGE